MKQRGFLSSLKQGGVPSEQWTWFDENLEKNTKVRVSRVHSMAVSELLVDALNYSDKNLVNIDEAVNTLLDDSNYMVALLQKKRVLR